MKHKHTPKTTTTTDNVMITIISVDSSPEMTYPKQLTNFTDYSFKL